MLNKMKNDIPIENLIRHDHKEVQTLYQQFKNSTILEDKKKFFNQLVWEVCRHMIAEEIIFYPLVKKYLPNGEALSIQLAEEHKKVKVLLADLQSLEMNTYVFDQKMTEFYEDLNRHMDKEEVDELPLITLHVPEAERINAGAKFENRKLIAPTRPHTMISSTSPMLETIESLLVAPVDKFLDLFKKFPEKSELPS